MLKANVAQSSPRRLPVRGNPALSDIARRSKKKRRIRKIKKLIRTLKTEK